MQRLGSGGSGRPSFNSGRGGGQLVCPAVIPPQALGFRRTQPTRDHLLLWDYQGTLFMLRNGVMSSLHGQLTWRRAARPSILCRHAKDVRGSVCMCVCVFACNTCDVTMYV